MTRSERRRKNAAPTRRLVEEEVHRVIMDFFGKLIEQQQLL